MQHLHIISHTHWDREWYRTFQEFRLKLVHLVDNLLAILDSDPTYMHYMLDGQTIVLEDYLQMRMANFPRLQEYIQKNRILIGPWYILPDEFLVSPEATIRNLLIGKQICELFGQRMMVGYIPDPFGHISQMPQILNGFHIDTACLWRGVKPEAPTLLWWQSPDGSRVLLAHLYNSYGNLADWPASGLEQSKTKLDESADALLSNNPSSHFLLMRGSDHLEPRSELPEAIRYYNQNSLHREAIHSTLPAYLSAVTDEMNTENFKLATIRGELRDPQKAHLLPAVLSSRMWIKQRNHYSETLLERWVEPFATWAELQRRGTDSFTPLSSPEKSERISDPSPIIHQAWKLLITNHPHDSICGCSIDQVHAEMVSRFDQVDQIGKELTDQALKTLTADINTQSNQKDTFAAISVFNASPYDQTDLVEVKVDLPSKNSQIKLTTQEGIVVPTEEYVQKRQLIESNIYTLSALMGIFSDVVSNGRDNKSLIDVSLAEDEAMPCINAEFSEIIRADDEKISKAFSSLIEKLSFRSPDEEIRVRVFSVSTALVRFVAKNVPAFGNKTYWISLKDEQICEPISFEKNFPVSHTIQNEFLAVDLDTSTGSVSVTDKRTKKEYVGMNRFMDVGDRGDEYNFCPPENDFPCFPQINQVKISNTPLEENLTLDLILRLPKSLDKSRQNRSKATVDCPLITTISLKKDCPFVDVHVEFDNRAWDHRLSVCFPTGMRVDTARFDGHFDSVVREIDLPQNTKVWQELPRPEVPQRTFTDVSTEKQGFMLANFGLPEVSVQRDTDENTQICLTLLRCIGWLSRDDLWTRKGQAGPPLPTPSAQELGLHRFNYRLIPHNGDWMTASQLAHCFQTPLTPQVTTLHEGELPSVFSMVSIEPASFLVTAIKPSLNEKGWIVRGVNISEERIQLSIKPNVIAHTAALVNLDESLIAEVPLDAENSVHLNVLPKQVTSILFGISE